MNSEIAKKAAKLMALIEAGTNSRQETIRIAKELIVLADASMSLFEVPTELFEAIGPNGRKLALGAFSATLLRAITKA